MSKNLAKIHSMQKAEWPQAPIIMSGSPVFDAIREKGLTRAKLTSPPELADEWWRYSKFDLFELGTLTDSEAVNFELRDFSSQSSLVSSAQIELRTPSGAQDEKLLNQILLARESEQSLEGLSDFHLACAKSCSIVKIAANARIEKPILLSQVISKANAKAAAPIIIVEVGSGSVCTLIEDLSFNNCQHYFPRVEIIIGDAAEFEFVSSQRLPKEAVYYARHRLHVGRDVIGRISHLATGAKVSRVDLDCRFYKAGSNVELYGLYLADDKRLVDYHPCQEHLAPYCKSELYFKGVVKDRARAVYYGYIKVSEGAQKTDAYQANRNMLLSSEARADSIPNLNIKANDVRCSHGSSVGQVGSDELFYLMSRGLTREQAERLLVQGFMEDLLAKIKNPLVHDYLSKLILERLDNRGA